MKLYTSTIPFELAKKLKEAGMRTEARLYHSWFGDIEITSPYAEVFDWLFAQKRIRIYIILKDRFDKRWYPLINERDVFPRTAYDTWHEAANAAIEKALELFKKDKK